MGCSYNRFFIARFNDSFSEEDIEPASPHSRDCLSCLDQGSAKVREPCLVMRPLLSYSALASKEGTRPA